MSTIGYLRVTARAQGLNSAAALDGSGILYITDSMNRRIRRVDAVTGVIQTIAGNGVDGFSGDGLATSASICSPASLAIDRSGKIYFPDEGNQRIRVLTPVVQPRETLHGPATMRR